MAEYRYPEDLAVLYDNKEKNYIKFSRITYKSARYIDGNSKKYETGYEISDSITLELPLDINLPESQTWESGDLFTTKKVDSFKSALEIGVGVSDRVLQVLGVTALNKVTGLLGGTIDPDIARNQYNFQQGRTIINPNTTLIFSGTGVRELVLNFNLQARSMSEAQAINNISHLFKQASRADASASGVDFPDTWMIHTSSKKLDRLLDLGYADKLESNKFAGSIPFALTTYNPTIKTPFLYHNEYAPELDLMMVFSELKPKYRYRDQNGALSSQ